MANNEQRCKDAMRMLERELERHARAEKLKLLGVIVTTLATLLSTGGGICLLTTAGGADGNEAADESTTPIEPAALIATLVGGEKAPMKHSFPLPETVSCDYPDDDEASKDIDKPVTNNTLATGTITITLKTNQGDIPMELDRVTSPYGVSAIGHVAKSDCLNGAVHYRITGDGLNVLQCGDPTGIGTGGPGSKLAGERPAKDSGPDQNIPLVYPKGSIAMASPSSPDANDSQFSLNWADSQLPPQYIVSGPMTDEDTKTVTDVVKNGIEGGSTSDGKPAKGVRIEKAEVKQLT